MHNSLTRSPFIINFQHFSFLFSFSLSVFYYSRTFFSFLFHPHHWETVCCCSKTTALPFCRHLCAWTVNTLDGNEYTCGVRIRKKDCGNNKKCLSRMKNFLSAAFWIYFKMEWYGLESMMSFVEWAFHGVLSRKSYKFKQLFNKDKFTELEGD